MIEFLTRGGLLIGGKRAAEALILAGATIVAAVPWTREHLDH
jgi:hypothetical protein